MRRALPMLLPLALLGGCGNTPARPPDVVTPDAPRGTRTVKIERANLRFTAPGNWGDLPASGPRAGGIRSQTATVAVWRYTRSEPLPATDTALEDARTRLIDRVRSRDPSFALRDSRATRRGGVGAIELLGRQHIGGRPFDVRSSHLFSEGQEIVIDAYARPQDFGRLDATVFLPLLRSLHVGGRRR